MAGTVSGVAIEPQPGEQVVCQDLTGELSDSLSEIRKETHSWNTKWRCVFVNHIPQSSTIVCCHERELRGFVHGDDFILVTGDYVQLIWIDSRLKEGLNFERCTNLGVDDGADETVTILWKDLTSALSHAVVSRCGQAQQEIRLHERIRSSRDTRTSRSRSSFTSTSRTVRRRRVR